MFDFQWYLYSFNCNYMAFVIMKSMKQGVGIDRAKPATKKKKKKKEKRMQTKCH